MALRGLLRRLMASWRSRPGGTAGVWVKGAAHVDAHLGEAPRRLLIFCERPAATQDVHLLRPLRRLRRQGACAVVMVSEASIAQAGGAGWLEAAWKAVAPTAVVLSRFAGPETSAVVEMARLKGTPLITHLDDFLLDVPPDLGLDKVKRHNRPERVAALRESLAGADLLYISTSSLADRLRRSGFDRPMIVARLQSCADAGEIAESSAEAPRDDRVSIGYQGTRNHHLDLAMVMPAVIKVLNARPQAVFELFGTIEPPPEASELGDRFRRHPPAADYDQFLDGLKALDWDIGLAPLRDTEFNSFRTYTKWTEYTLAGTAVIASAGVVYKDVIGDDAGLLAGPEDWEAALLRMVDDVALRRSAVAHAQARLRQDLNLGAMERQWLDVLEAADAEVRRGRARTP